MGRVNPMGIVVSILLIFAVAGLGLCIIVNEWYYLEGDMSSQGNLVEARTSFGLRKATVTVITENVTIQGTVEYEDENNTQTPTGDMFEKMFYMVIIGTILTVAFIVMGFLAAFYVVPGWSTLLVGLFAAVLLLAGPGYMWVVLPGVWEEEKSADGGEPVGDGPWTGFMGSNDE